MFEVTEHAVKVVSVTNIGEKHGNERKPAVSVKMELTGPNSLLDMFDPELKSMLFQPATKDPDQLEVNTDALVELRVVHARKITWAKKYAGYQLRFVIGATGKEDVLLNDVDLKGFEFIAIEGGSVTIVMKAHARPMTPADQGKIAQMVQSETTITLKAPEIEQSSLLEEDEAA